MIILIIELDPDNDGQLLLRNSDGKISASDFFSLEEVFEYVKNNYISYRLEVSEKVVNNWR